MDSVNNWLFGYINATATSPDWLIGLALFFAKWLIFIIPIMLVASWLWGRDRRFLFNVVMSLVIAFLLSKLIGELYYYSRPFAQGIGHQYLSHAKDASFPSDHGIGAFTFALAFIYFGARKTGLFLLACAVAIAWSRVYLGVHWPLDMVGAFIVAMVSCVIAKQINLLVGAKILSLIESVYRLCFSPFIRRGWVKY